MKLESNDLLLAAEILELASAIRKDEWIAFASAAGLDWALNTPAMKAWRESHPVSEFVPAALRQLEEVALQVAAIKASSP